MEEGGGIKWLGFFIPLIDESTAFIENYAIYGNNVAAVPIKLVIIVYKILNNSYNPIYFNSNVMNQSINLENTSNGQTVPYFIKIQPFDIYDQLVLENSGFLFGFLLKYLNSFILGRLP